MKIPSSLQVALVIAVSTSFAWADVMLPAIISNQMVLEKAGKVPIWGQADPGEEVTVTFAGTTAKVIAGADGKWMVTLNLKDSGTGPFAMTIAGKNKLTLSDVVVGEVWLASGQSNMDGLSMAQPTLKRKSSSLPILCSARSWSKRTPPANLSPIPMANGSRLLPKRREAFALSDISSPRNSSTN